MIREHHRRESKKSRILKLTIIALGAFLLPALPRGGDPAPVFDSLPLPDPAQITPGVIPFAPAPRTEPVLGTPVKPATKPNNS